MELKVIEDGIKRRKIEKLNEDIEYLRIVNSFAGAARGTVIIGKRAIFGFPHIKRIFTLEKGLVKNMAKDVFYAEEKIDGFNIRIASIDGKLCAFSRGGFLDRFVTEKIREMKLEKFFSDYPNAVLCAEMVGNTPYTEPTKAFDVKMYIFDIDDGSGTYFGCGKKYAIMKKYGLNGVPVLGRFKVQEHKKLQKLVLKLNKSRREGVILKSEDRRYVIKYVTPWSDIDDIEENSELFFDMPLGFYHQRVLRSAISINDFGMNETDYARILGKAFYKGLIKSVKAASVDKEIYRQFEILIRDETIWDSIFRHMSHEVKIELVEKTRLKDGRIKIIFRKIYKNTTHKLRSYMNGKGIED